MGSIQLTVLSLCAFAFVVEIDAQHRYNNRVITFDDPGKTTVHPKFPISRRSRDACTFDEYGICEQSDVYPQRKMTQFVRNQTQIESFLGQVIEPQVDVIDRFGDSFSSFCRTQTKTLIPKVAKNIKDEEMFIFNLGGDLTQVVTFEVCENKEEGCPEYNRIIIDLESKCQQKFNVIKLLACSVDNCDKLIYDKFRIPSTCVCVLKSMADDFYV